MLRLSADQFVNINERYLAAQEKKSSVFHDLPQKQKLDQLRKDSVSRAWEIADILQKTAGPVTENLPKAVLAAGVQNSLLKPSMIQAESLSAQGMISYMTLADMVSKNGPWTPVSGLDEVLNSIHGGSAPEPDNPFVQQMAKSDRFGPLTAQDVRDLSKFVSSSLGGAFLSSDGQVANGFLSNLGNMIPDQFQAFPREFPDLAEQIGSQLDLNELKAALSDFPPNLKAVAGGFQSAFSNPLLGKGLEMLGIGKEAQLASQAIAGINLLNKGVNPLTLLDNPLAGGVLSYLGLEDELQKLENIQRILSGLLETLHALGVAEIYSPRPIKAAKSVIRCRVKPPTVGKPISVDLPTSDGSSSKFPVKPKEKEKAQSSGDSRNQEKDIPGPGMDLDGNILFERKGDTYDQVVEIKADGTRITDYYDKDGNYKFSMIDGTLTGGIFGSLPEGYRTDAERELDAKASLENVMRGVKSNSIDLAAVLDRTNPNFRQDIFDFIQAKKGAQLSADFSTMSIEVVDGFLIDTYHVAEFQAVDGRVTESEGILGDLLGGGIAADTSIGSARYTVLTGNDMTNPYSYQILTIEGPSVSLQTPIMLGNVGDGFNGVSVGGGALTDSASVTYTAGVILPDLSTPFDSGDEIEISVSPTAGAVPLGYQTPQASVGHNPELERSRLSVNVPKIPIIGLGIGLNVETGKK